MIRLIKALFLLSLAVVLLTIALANREPATLTLLTPELAEFARFNWSQDIPLFLIVFGGIVAGLLIGFVWEWLSEAKHRQTVVQRERQVRELKKEVIRLRGEKHAGQDEVLALLEEAPAKSAG